MFRTVLLEPKKGVIMLFVVKCAHNVVIPQTKHSSEQFWKCASFEKMAQNRRQFRIALKPKQRSGDDFDWTL